MLCVRTSPARWFPGLERLEACRKLFQYDAKVASFIKRHTSLRVVRPRKSEWIEKRKLRMKLFFEAKFITHWKEWIIRTSYLWKPIETSAELPPPKGLYVVVGIFSDSGALLEEVIVYTGGQSLSRSLVLERRRLFSLPILRDIKAFGLYKVSFFCS